MRKTVLLTALLVAGSAYGHTAPSGMEYSAYCCNGDGMSGDCQPIPSRSVKAVSGGYQISLNPGDHRLVTRQHVFFIPYDKVREATDGGYHACLYPDEDTLRCFYAPPQSF
ncbi:hypothetical protein FHT87_005196 [Rhizobium sp. BK316]|uniref:hypothetical protein n=1 Tax=Rhizobium sp. BK316 TaxID=2587053 RepID=UPI0016200D8F|nr:hypothetical protein [Rhizobium sp. BK316]MBB3411243.1 hypothetical protein [Rhizobium sp. BK316]